MALVLAGIVLFVGGFAVRGNDALMARLGVDQQGETSTTTSSTTDTSALASRINEVVGVLEGSSVDTVDTDSATETLINALLNSTGDSYTRYYSADRYESYVDTTTTQYPGVGVLFSEYKGQAYALDVFENSSAASAGVQPGDYVVAIDGDRSQTWTATEAINAVQRAEGSTVVITWRHAESLDDTGGEEYTTTLTTSADYTEPNVSTQLVGSVGYIKLTQFTQNSDSLVRTAIQQLTDQGATSFVLDLRDNPGGYLSRAVDVASLFIRSGVIVQMETADGTTTREASGDVATSAPLVVLVNGNTSGSAEVVAAALRDTDRATIVGTTTMGHGSIQVAQQLSFGGAIRYTAATYSSPDGYSLNGVGVSPDITVTMDANSTDDTQKNFAVETAQSLTTTQ